MSRRLAPAVAVVALAVTAAAPLGAQRVTVNFAEYASPANRTYQATFGAPLTSRGFDFYQAFPTSGSRNVLATWGTAGTSATNRPSNVGSANTMFVDSPTLGADIYVAGDDPFVPALTFNMYSIDVAHLFAVPFVPILQPFTLQFFGAYLDGTTTTQTFTVAAPAVVNGVQTPLLQTLTFSNAFRGVSNVYWYQNGVALSQQHQFTNITVEVTPEPGTYLLVAAGLGGLAALARRRRAAHRPAA